MTGGYNMLGSINDYFLEVYKLKPFIIKKKSEYLLIINLITLFSIVTTLLVHILGNNNFVNKFGDVIFILACSFVLIYLKKGKLEKAVNLYIGGYIFILFN